ncbi:hypothetical protein ACFP2V_36835 [Streptomyces incanus]|uniref:Uncharacterized protein n=1 Tax=Streptomyces incanus TaxID=887453 RepID=A0ABW0XXU5_9ACTN
MTFGDPGAMRFVNESVTPVRDLSTLVVPQAGKLLRTCLRQCLHPRARLRPVFDAPSGPTQRPCLVEIRGNLIGRIEEAEREGRRGEVAGLPVGLGGAEAKLARLDSPPTGHLGVPGLRRVAGRHDGKIFAKPIGARLG